MILVLFLILDSNAIWIVPPGFSFPMKGIGSLVIVLTLFYQQWYCHSRYADKSLLSYERDVSVLDFNLYTIIHGTTVSGVPTDLSFCMIGNVLYYINLVSYIIINGAAI